MKKQPRIVEDVVSGKQILLLELKDRLRSLFVNLQLPPICLLCESLDGWMFTNHETVATSIAKYKKFLKMEEDGSLDKLPEKKVQLLSAK